MKKLKQLLLEKDHAGIQFLKYGFCGGVAMMTDMFVFFFAAWLLFPALSEDEWLVRLLNLSIDPISDFARMINFWISNLLAFVVSNLVAYVLNLLFVFKGGRHSRWKELGLFYLVSASSIVLGTALGAVLIQFFECSTAFSYLAKAVAAVLINYVMRKFVVFKG